ncbi:MAG: chemotaxis protein CheW [Candidatus Edwardsbacteria bacterium]
MNTQRILTIKIGKQIFGIKIEQVKEIVRRGEILEKQKLPPQVLGIVSFRGINIPLVNLAFQLNLTDEKKPKGKKNFLLSEIKGISLGFLIDGAGEILEVSEEKIKLLPPLILNKRNSSCLSAILQTEERLIIILNLEGILSERELKKLVHH